VREWNNDQDRRESSEERPIPPQRLAMMIGEESSNDAIICCDTGSVTVWAARNLRIKGSQKFTLSGDLASMAFGLPAAIGAQLLFPEKQVIALCGDGGFAMLMCDFATAVKYGLPIKVFIFNNGKLAMIQQEQEARSGNPEYQTDLFNPDYAAFAEICGGKGYTVKEPGELASTIRTALDAPQPCIVNVFVDPDELMWPPKVTFEETVNYTKAKIKEFLIKH
jgi:pyruvate oxidase